MQSGDKKKHSLYTILAWVIVITVVLGIGLHDVYDYWKEKQHVREIQEESTLQSIASLQKNLAIFIESYAVNEYQNLVATEVESGDHFAIIVRDFNMGKILGADAYISGKIRDVSGEITDFDPDDEQHVLSLEQSHYSATEKIGTAEGTPLGEVTIYSTDEQFNKLLSELLVHSIYEISILVVFLVAMLLLAIHQFLVRPLSRIARNLKETDEDGIPLSPVPSNEYREIAVLTDTMNNMIDVIKNSRQREKRTIEELDMERGRFQLAIEGSQDGLWDWDPIRNTVFYSKQWGSMLGYEEADLGHSYEFWRSKVHPNDVDAAVSLINAHLAGKTDVYESRHRLRCKDGTWKWILSRGKALFDEEGKPLRFVGFHTDITQQVQHQEELEHSAKHDVLTKLPNRFLFSELIQSGLHRCKRNKKHLALLYVDLDGFKEINDSLGHEAGDVVLVATAQRMKAVVRQEDVVARLGGDEFVIAVSDLNGEEELPPLLHRLLHDLQLPIHYQGAKDSLQVSASIGVTLYPQTIEIGPEALLRQADQAMYMAKNGGKNQYQLFNHEMDTSLKAQQEMIGGVRRAIAHNEFVLHYQPKVDMAQGKIIGFEALLRWQHPTRGMLYPDSFLPQLAEEKRLMIELGEWVFNAAFVRLSEWLNSGHDFTLSLNVSAHEFKNDHSLRLLDLLLQQHEAVHPSHIELEILETSALEDTEEAMRMIRACQQRGFRVSLDDFGTGYSTLSYLRDLPVNTLKVDKSFVMEMLHDSGSMSILEAAMGLAEAFRCDVVAEGVESVEHGVLLLQLGCKVAQGYAIAKPMPAEQVAEWISNYQPEKKWLETETIRDKNRTALYAVAEHRLWVMMFEQHISAPEAYPLPEADPGKCRFGIWLKGEARESYSADQLETISALHDSMHEKASAALGEHSHKDLVAVKMLHKKIVQGIEALIETR